jgi:site-specific DNA recombinase
VTEGPRWRAVIYNRASADKTGQRVSVRSQETENRAWCDREDWEVAAVVSDSDRSATRFATRDREGYREVRDGLAGGRWGRVDVLVMWESSRGQRRLDGYLELRDLCETYDVRLAYRGRIYNLAEGDDRFSTGLDALLDEREAERVRDRIERSHRASVAEGKARGGIPYGYRRTYSPGTRRMERQVPDPRTKAVVAGIVADLLAGRTLHEIASRLNCDRVVTPQGERALRRGAEPSGQWTSSMIRNMLSKRSLIGERTHRGVVTGPAEWEPIVDPPDWRAVQALLGDPSRVRHHGGRDARWLLSGIAECAVCGAWLRPMRLRGRMTYACAGVVPTAPKGHVSRDAAALDAVVVLHVVQRLSAQSFLVDLAGHRAGARTEAARARMEVDGLEAELASWIVAAREGRVSASSFAAIEPGLQDKLEQARAQMVSAAEVPEVVLGIAGGDAARKWDDADLDTQRRTVRAMLRVRVHRTTVPGSSRFDLSSIELIDRLGRSPSEQA